MAATYPKFDGFSLQDDNYIMSEINYRLIPTRRLETDKILRRPGVKLLSADFTQRIVTMRGHIIANSVTELRDKIDELHTNVTRKESGVLYIESDRSSTATVDSLSIGDPFYSQTYVPIEIQFLLADPFFYGEAQTVNMTVTSGVASMSQNITISGSVFAEPSIAYFAPSGSDSTYTTTSGIIIEYSPTGEKITWSGSLGNTKLNYGGNVTFDYVSHLLLENTTAVHPEGLFARWEPGSTTFTVTFSGTALGGSLQFTYQPRYL